MLCLLHPVRGRSRGDALFVACERTTGDGLGMLRLLHTVRGRLRGRDALFVCERTTGDVCFAAEWGCFVCCIP